MVEKKLTNLKSLDGHVLMTKLLPVMMRGILPDNVWLTIVKLCAFLNAVSQKVIDPENLIKLQNDVVKCVRNRARPEGRIASAYGTEEVIDFCVDFIDLN